MNLRSLLALCLLTLFSLSALSAANFPSSANQAPEGESITLEEYWDLVRNTRGAIDQIEGQPEAEVRRELNRLASKWEQVTGVERPGQSVVQIDSSRLVVELRRQPPELERLGKMFEALLQAHEEYPQEVFTLEDIDPLEEILGRPEFQWREQKATTFQKPNWLLRFEEWLARLTIGTVNATFQYGRIPLIVAAILLFAFSLFFISRSISRSLVREAQLAAEESDGDDLLTSKTAFKRAETLSSHGDYRNAIRYLYISSLLVLDEQGLMRYDRSRTNREYLRSISSKPELAKPLRDVIDVFDRVWYGFEGVDEQTYQSYVERVDELREKKE